MDLQLQLASKGHALTYASPEISGLPKWAVWQNQAYGTTFEPVSYRVQQTAFARGCGAAESCGSDSLAERRSRLFKEKIATFDPEKSGVGFLMMTQDAKVFPQFWDLAKGLGPPAQKFIQAQAPCWRRSVQANILWPTILSAPMCCCARKKILSLGLVLPKDYTLVFSRVAFISKTARNPNAAKLFLDYILSKRGQTVMSEKSLVYSIRSDVPGQITAAGLTKDLGKALKPIEVNTDILAGLEQNKRLEFMKQWKAA